MLISYPLRPLSPGSYVSFGQTVSTHMVTKHRFTLFCIVNFIVRRVEFEYYVEDG
jgi:hypothetical protein